jgi:hypothetical protein
MSSVVREVFCSSCLLWREGIGQCGLRPGLVKEDMGEMEIEKLIQESQFNLHSAVETISREPERAREGGRDGGERERS